MSYLVWIYQIFDTARNCSESGRQANTILPERNDICISLIIWHTLRATFIIQVKSRAASASPCCASCCAAPCCASRTQHRTDGPVLYLPDDCATPRLPPVPAVTSPGLCTAGELSHKAANWSTAEGGRSARERDLRCFRCRLPVPAAKSPGSRMEGGDPTRPDPIRGLCGRGPAFVADRRSDVYIRGKRLR